MRWKIDTALYAQGWLASQFNAMNEAAIAASPDPDNSVIEFHNAVATMEKILQQWRVLSETMDDLVKENFNLHRQLTQVRKAAAPPEK